jgi:hypothetical protein
MVHQSPLLFWVKGGKIHWFEFYVRVKNCRVNCTNTNTCSYCDVMNVVCYVSHSFSSRVDWIMIILFYRVAPKNVSLLYNPNIPGDQVLNPWRGNLLPRCSFRLWKRLIELYLSRVQTRGFVYTLRMTILTCAWLKLDDSAEFQIVPTISNQISILYRINLSF